VTLPALQAWGNADPALQQQVKGGPALRYRSHAGTSKRCTSVSHGARQVLVPRASSELFPFTDGETET